MAWRHLKNSEKISIRKDKKKKGALQGQRSWRMNDLYPFSIFLLLTETLSTPWLGESGTP